MPTEKTAAKKTAKSFEETLFIDALKINPLISRTQKELDEAIAA